MDAGGGNTTLCTKDNNDNLYFSGMSLWLFL